MIPVEKFKELSEEPPSKPKQQLFWKFQCPYCNKVRLFKVKYVHHKHVFDKRVIKHQHKQKLKDEFTCCRTWTIRNGIAKTWSQFQGGKKDVIYLTPIY